MVSTNLSNFPKQEKVFGQSWSGFWLDLIRFAHAEKQHHLWFSNLPGRWRSIRSFSIITSLRKAMTSQILRVVSQVTWKAHSTAMDQVADDLDIHCVIAYENSSVSSALCWLACPQERVEVQSDSSSCFWSYFGLHSFHRKICPHLMSRYNAYRYFGTGWA